MNPRYIIVGKYDSTYDLTRKLSKVASIVSYKNNIIIARHGVNKTTLQKIIRKELRNV